ncbi:putative F-box/LRR-repeat protein At5g41840 [Alnus glutinosa]|uniref:putative F-box/LRR-repeat protein At5g41840 n=1 Tax=Alnus glutinosa TaxID=3517 RepID=UPI002D7841CB|nr:putative F-box/LRR-repeat protein At5g41840 [Alnus glutinosa]
MNKIDRISELPDPILEHILAFIPMKQILQLSILSKRWKNVCTLFPIPEFEQQLFTNSFHEVPPSKRKKEYRRKKQEFKNFVGRYLLGHYRQRLSINKFKLHMMLDGESDCALLNRWIDYVIECNVKELNLDVWIHQKRYELPERALVAKSITELKLSQCKLKSFYSEINLPSLKKLDLEIIVENQVVQTLFDGCRNLEEMRFEYCYGLKSLQVSVLPKLKVIELIDNPQLENVEIEASNLESLLLNLKRSCQINLGRVLKRINISGHRMKSLAIIYCSELVEVDIVTPNLDRLEYGGGVISFSLSTSSLSELSLTFNDSSDVEKIEFLANLNHPKLLNWKTVKAEVRIRA